VATDRRLTALAALSNMNACELRFNSIFLLIVVLEA
jgi:hypothetical protein